MELGVFVQDRSALTTYDALLAVQTRPVDIAGRYVMVIAPAAVPLSSLRRAITFRAPVRGSARAAAHQLVELTTK